MTFFVFLAVVTVVYIGNGYYAQKTMSESIKLTNDIKNMQGEYVNLQSKLAQKTTLSTIAVQGKNLGLREAITPPAKLIVNTQK
ncbi:MAG: FtsL-like putative cell division protein [Sphingobacteriales bacterium JAD_PAG50586_3]|nr:MAG: FtsL-like putative cell division protein [Sphingobacteriales bacterium JAD_PAG50586_3]